MDHTIWINESANHNSPAIKAVELPFNHFAEHVDRDNFADLCPHKLSGVLKSAAGIKGRITPVTVVETPGRGSETLKVHYI